MEVRSPSGSTRGRRVSDRETPGTTGSQTFETSTFVVPFARACIAVVRMEISGEQVLTSGAQRTILCTDECKIPTLSVVKGSLASGGGRARMLPTVTFAT